MLEKAIQLTPFDRISPTELKKFDRVYIGSNFCSNLIPKISDIIRLKDLGVKNITVSTPFLTDNDFNKTIKLIKESLKIISKIEISANDIGLIDKIKEIKGLDILLARPISHDWLRMNPKSLKKFLKRFRIKYVETDEEYMVKRFKDAKINFSFHYPLEYLSMSRICPFERKINDALCEYRCLNKNIVELKETGRKDVIYLKNNAYFKKNIPVKTKNIKRTVLFYYGQKI